jgi:glutathione S-transferase
MTRLRLLENAFSPFARKVRMVLEHKGLAFETVDGLHRESHEALAAVNPRREVPVLVDGATVVVNSSHIVAYLEDAYPRPPVLPGDAAARARIRDWERLADTLLDPIVVDVSLWSWAKRRRAISMPSTAESRINWHGAGNSCAANSRWPKSRSSPTCMRRARSGWARNRRGSRRPSRG